MADTPPWRPTQPAVEQLLRDHLRQVSPFDHMRRAADAVAALFGTIGHHSMILRVLTADDVRTIIAAIPPPNLRQHDNHNWTRCFLRAAAAHSAAQIPATTAQETTRS